MRQILEQETDLLIAVFAQARYSNLHESNCFSGKKRSVLLGIFTFVFLCHFGTSVYETMHAQECFCFWWQSDDESEPESPPAVSKPKAVAVVVLKQTATKVCISSYDQNMLLSNFEFHFFFCFSCLCWEKRGPHLRQWTLQEGCSWSLMLLVLFTPTEHSRVEEEACSRSKESPEGKGKKRIDLCSCLCQFSCQSFFLCFSSDIIGWCLSPLSALTD